MKPIPKSLHTHTVLVSMALLLRSNQKVALTAEYCVHQVVYALGLHDKPDTYDLIPRAIAAVEAAVKK